MTSADDSGPAVKRRRIDTHAGRPNSRPRRGGSPDPNPFKDVYLVPPSPSSKFSSSAAPAPACTEPILVQEKGSASPMCATTPLPSSGPGLLSQTLLVASKWEDKAHESQDRVNFLERVIASLSQQLQRSEKGAQGLEAQISKLQSQVDVFCRDALFWKEQSDSAAAASAKAAASSFGLQIQALLRQIKDLEGTLRTYEEERTTLLDQIHALQKEVMWWKNNSSSQQDAPPNWDELQAQFHRELSEETKRVSEESAQSRNRQVAAAIMVLAALNLLLGPAIMFGIATVAAFVRTLSIVDESGDTIFARLGRGALSWTSFAVMLAKSCICDCFSCILEFAFAHLALMNPHQIFAWCQAQAYAVLLAHRRRRGRRHNEHQQPGHQQHEHHQQANAPRQEQ